MPIDTMIFCTAVVSMFVVFAGVLIWGSHQTSQMQPVRLPSTRS